MMCGPNTRPLYILPLFVLLVSSAGLEFVAGADGKHRIAKKELIFRDASQETGLTFDHFLGATGSYYMPEIMGSGVALLDYDNDGDLDVYFLQGTILDPAKSLQHLTFLPPKKHWPGNRLFRNELVPSGRLQFDDVTEEAGVGDNRFGMGAAAGDYDNDGHTDLYVTNCGRNTLYKNNGDGSFVDVTAEAGVGLNSFSASAVFVDYDHDGDLDLFVTRYNAFSIQGNKDCYSHTGGRDYCGPREYFPLPDVLYRNDGEGRFSNVTKEAGISAAFGNGLGVVAGFFNSDGRIDIYVANDKTPNQLWINQGDGTFEDYALISGTAYNADGMAEAGMGVSAADFDGDGDEDLFLTHIGGETNTLYVNDGDAMFDDETTLSGLGHTSTPFTGFGTLWFDYDNDGLLDLFSANGEVRIIDPLRGQPFPYAQRNQLFHHEGEHFREMTEEAGSVFALKEVSRGAAFGDVDNDGDTDIVLANANGPARLLLNEIGARNHWLQVKLQGVEDNRDGYGARVGLLRKGRPLVWRRAGTDGSYLSANDSRIHFGLGDRKDLRRFPVKGVVVQWLNGRTEQWKVTEADLLIRLTQGTGETLKGSESKSAPSALRNPKKSVQRRREEGLPESGR